MGFKTNVFLVLFLPITLGAIIILFTMYILIQQGTENFTDEMETLMIQDAKENIDLAVSATQQKLQSEYSQLVIYLIALNYLHFLSSQSQVAYPTNAASQRILSVFVNEYNFNEYDQLLQSHPSDSISKLKLLTSSYYNPNTNIFADLSTSDQQFIEQVSSTDALSYSILKYSGNSWLTFIQFYTINIETGSTYTFPNNIKPYQSKDSKQNSDFSNTSDCIKAYGQKQFPYEYRCSTWYKFMQSIHDVSTTFLNPFLQDKVDSDSDNHLVNSICTYSFDMKSISCIDYQLDSTQINSSNNIMDTDSPYYYLISAGTRIPIAYPRIDISKLNSIDFYEFQDSSDKQEEIEVFQEQSKIFEDITSSQNTCLGEKQSGKSSFVQFKKDGELQYLFYKTISTCDKVITDEFKTNFKKLSLEDLKSQTTVRAYLCYTIKADNILQGVLDIQNSIGLILVLDQIIIIFILILLVFKVFSITFYLSSQLISHVDNLVSCLRKIQSDQLEIVYQELSQELVDQEDHINYRKRKTHKFLKKKKRRDNSYENNVYNQSQSSSSSSSSSSQSSSSSSTSSSDSSDNEDDEQSSQNRLTKEESRRQKALKKSIKLESEKLIKLQREQTKEISSDLLILYRVLYEIVHVIKEANQIFMEGNEEQALMNYAKSIDFFRSLQNENAVSICLNNMGNVYMKQKQFIQASDKYQASLQFVKKQLDLLRALYKKSVSEKVLHTDEQYRYFSCLYISRSLHLAESLLEAMQEKPYDAMKYLGVVSSDECYLEIRNRYEGIKQQVKVFNPARSEFDPLVAHCLLQLALCSAELKKKSECIMYLEEAEDELKKDINPEYPFERHNFQKEILQQRVLFLKGYLNYQKSEFYISSIFLTKSIEYGKIYCPKLRRKALILLKTILKKIEDSQTISAFSGVDYLLDKYRPLIKDVFFLANISASMGTKDKILLASQTIQLVFQKYIANKFDRVAYYLFNESVRQVFPLQRVDKSWSFLENVLQYMPTVSGNGKVREALSEAFKVFDDNQYYAHCTNMKKVDLTYKKFVILFTDESDALQEGREARKEWQKIRENFKLANIILVIYAFTDNQEAMTFFKELVDYCQDGFVIHYKEYNTIQSYFQNLTEKLVPDAYEIEEIS